MEAADGPTRLLNRDFVLLWQGQLVSQLGDQAFTIATLFWTLEASGSASVMGLVMAAAFVPEILISPFAGTLADRHPRMRIVVACDVGRGALMLLLAVCFWTCPHRLLIPILLAVVFANGMLTAFFDAAINAAIPDLTPDRHLAGANSFHLFSRQGSTLAGQVLGGIAFQTSGAPVLFFVNGLTFLFSGATEAFVRLPARTRAPDDTSAVRAFLTSTRQGLRYVVRREGLLRFIAAVSVFNCLIMGIAALLPIYVSDYLGGGARWYGFLVAGLSAGSMIGCVAASRVNRLGGVPHDGQGRAWVLVSLFGGMGSALALLGQTRTHSIALALMVMAGAFAGMVGVTVLTTLQRTTPEHLRGRVLGLNTTLTRALAPVGIVVAGIVADSTGRNVPLIYAACGALAAATVVLLLGSRRSRAFLVSDLISGELEHKRRADVGGDRQSTPATDSRAHPRRGSGELEACIQLDSCYMRPNGCSPSKRKPVKRMVAGAGCRQYRPPSTWWRRESVPRPFRPADSPNQSSDDPATIHASRNSVTLGAGESGSNRLAAARRSRKGIR